MSASIFFLGSIVGSFIGSWLERTNSKRSAFHVYDDSSRASRDRFREVSRTSENGDRSRRGIRGPEQRIPSPPRYNADNSKSSRRDKTGGSSPQEETLESEEKTDIFLGDVQKLIEEVEAGKVKKPKERFNALVAQYKDGKTGKAANSEPETQPREQSPEEVDSD